MYSGLTFRDPCQDLEIATTHNIAKHHLEYHNRDFTQTTCSTIVLASLEAVLRL